MLIFKILVLCLLEQGSSCCASVEITLVKWSRCWISGIIFSCRFAQCLVELELDNVAHEVSVESNKTKIWKRLTKKSCFFFFSSRGSHPSKAANLSKTFVTSGRCRLHHHLSFPFPLFNVLLTSRCRATRLTFTVYSLVANTRMQDTPGVQLDYRFTIFHP